MEKYHPQKESQIEQHFIRHLEGLGYKYCKDIKDQTSLEANFRNKFEALNNVRLTDGEFERLMGNIVSSDVYKASKTLRDKVEVVHDDGTTRFYPLVNLQNWCKNDYEVINQLRINTHSSYHRYDVIILINGLPLVQVELKAHGVSPRVAIKQIVDYKNDRANGYEHTLLAFMQLFIVSNEADTFYFANNPKEALTFDEKEQFLPVCRWADEQNKKVANLHEFAREVLRKCTLGELISRYMVLVETERKLLIMRPYQIYAVKKMVECIKNNSGNGYIWHTTGSGKTLTSFKAATLLKDNPHIAKCLFVVDRKDLDKQTREEFNKFQKDCVEENTNTGELVRRMLSDEYKDKIIVTTIQKLGLALDKKNQRLDKLRERFAGQRVVFIFDECHRSQFGEAQKNIRKRFKKYYQFGFTGTPIFPENASGTDTTRSVFGAELHSYVITDAIRDEKVLKFKVDYNDVRPKFKAVEMEQDEDKLKASENNQLLLHPDRIRAISQYILKNFRIKTHRNNIGNRGFNAMFAVSSVDAAKLYYEELNALQKGSDKPLKIATIFSYPPNEEQHAVGEILDEGFEPSAMNSSSKEFLSKAISDYNAMFKSNYGLDSQGFQNYYRDLSEKVKNQEIDLLIVVGMFLTGFDAPTLNTLFVDKNLRYHGLIQAFSRTNRIYDATKTFGNIVTFRDLEEATIKAIQLFGTQQTRHVVLERSYKEYIEGFTDEVTGEKGRGYLEVVKELKERFPHPDQIETEAEKKAFVKLFGEYLKLENILQNYDEFTCLKALQTIDREDKTALEAFKEANFLTDDELKFMLGIDVPEERTTQDYRSAYNDIRDWFRQERMGQTPENPETDWDDIVFEVDLLKSQEIDLDYILELLFEHNKKTKDKDALVSEMRRIIRSSLDNRAKESLIVDFINATDLDPIQNKADIIEAFFAYAKERQNEEAATLIGEEHLKDEAARRYLQRSLKREYASMNGTDFNNMLPQMSPLDPRYLEMKQRVFQKISAFVEKFKGVGGFERR